jgi:cytoskeletal protein CcmA (bactofilin family)
MFQKKTTPTPVAAAPTERVTSVLGPGIIWKGNLRGSGGVRIEGAFEGDITLRGLVVIGETGRLTCEDLRANSVIVAGTVNGRITAEKLDIRSTGRVWGDVIVVALATEEGAFLRGQVRMEERIEIPTEADQADVSSPTPSGTPAVPTGLPAPGEAQAADQEPKA